MMSHFHLPPLVRLSDIKDVGDRREFEEWLCGRATIMIPQIDDVVFLDHLLTFKNEKENKDASL